jgi:hypothetical protein
VLVPSDQVNLIAVADETATTFVKNLGAKGTS